MKVPLEWLKEFVTIRQKPEALAARLTLAGLEGTGIESVDGQPVLHLEITPNRADCLSILGVAREVAAITNQRLKLPKVRSSEFGVRTKLRIPHSAFRIQIEDRKGCSRYIGRLIDGVTVTPSPAWMQRRLAACGIRAINNIVDVTNYVMLEWGQPLHAFDVDRLTEQTLLIRRARPKELITTLDGAKRELSVETLVIADATRAIAVAGVMGGMGSEVTPQTTRILLESACFDPLTVRRTARALGLTSESSYRFERGIDPGGVESASASAAARIQQLAGGTLRDVVDLGERSSKRTVISMQVSRANRWLGTSLTPSTARASLARLGCHVSSSGTGDALHVGAPSFRRDLAQPVDLYEELARVVGYDRLPQTLPSGPIAPAHAGSSAPYWRLQSLRCLCASLGLVEAINWSLVSEAELSRCHIPVSDVVKLANPLSQDHAYLRPSLLIGLLRAVRRNLTQDAPSVRLFEVGRVFRPSSTNAEGVEAPRLGIALSGLWSRDWRTQEPCDLFRLKGVIETLLGRLCDGTLRLASTELPWAEPGSGTTLELSGRSVGVAAHVSRSMTEALDLDQPVWIAELDIEQLLVSRRAPSKIQVPVTVPPVKRDLSLVVPEGTSCDAILRAIREVGGALASHVELIDRYTGQPVPAGSSSLTFSINYRDPRRTLTATEVDQLHTRIGQTLIERFGAHLR